MNIICEKRGIEVELGHYIAPQLRLNAGARKENYRHCRENNDLTVVEPFFKLAVTWQSLSYANALAAFPHMTSANGRVRKIVQGIK